MNTKEKSKHRFNFVDALIILLILAVVAVVAFIFLFRGASFLTNLFGGGQTTEIYYAVELSLVREELVSNIEPGDPVTDAVKNYDIGTVVGVLSDHGEFHGADEDGNVVVSPYPGYQSLIVVIRTEATEGEFNYSIDGYELQTGSVVSFSTANLAGTGYCIGLEPVETEEDKAEFWEYVESIYQNRVFTERAPETEE